MSGGEFREEFYEWVDGKGYVMFAAGYGNATMTEAERIARALHTITIQLGTGQWSLHEIRHILEGKDK